MNDAVRHQVIYMDAWSKIKALQNHFVKVKSLKGGLSELKVLPSVEHEDFKELCKEDEKYLQSENSIYMDESKFSYENFGTCFSEF